MRWLKPALHVVLAAPLAWLLSRVYIELSSPGSGLGADPNEAIVHFLGEWALRVLLFAFTVTPLRRLLKSPALARCRRMIGLWAFAYAALHLVSYVAFYLEFSLVALGEDFVERPYITVGLAAFSALLVMAATSTRGWQRRLRQGWRRLHRVVYPAVALALVHLWWLTRDGFGELVVYTIWFAILLGARAWYARPRQVAVEPS